METSKRCSKCKTIKNFSEFHKSKISKDGVQCYCISCNKDRVKSWKEDNKEHLKDSKNAWSRTKRGLIFNIYSDQKYNSISRGHIEPQYTRDEFLEWVLSKSLFCCLYHKWAESGYDPQLRPSLDRTDESIGYHFDNIQLMTWEENKEKGRISHLSGSYDCMPICQYDMDHNLIDAFISQADAARKTGFSQAGISRCINGVTPKYKDCLWEKV